jgi:hypothetical protein
MIAREATQPQIGIILSDKWHSMRSGRGWSRDWITVRITEAWPRRAIPVIAAKSAQPDIVFRT